MSAPFQEFEANGYTVKLFQDEEPSSPREWSNLGIMFTPHPRYTLGDAADPSDEYRAAKRAYDHFPTFEMFCRYLRIFLGATQVVPVGLIDHSGLSMYVGGGPSPFDPGGWDSGTIGVIFDTARTREECGTPLDLIRECLEGEVKTYDQYLTGDVNGYVIEDAYGVEVESCWGFYGVDDVRQQAKAAAEAMDPAPTKEPQEVRRRTARFGDLLATHDSASGQGVKFYAWTDGWAIGYRCVHEDGREYYVALSPSSASDTDVSPDVFVYEGEGPSVAEDMGPVIFINVFEPPKGADQ